jgi:hypothetical protein
MLDSKTSQHFFRKDFLPFLFQRIYVHHEQYPTSSVV